MAGQIALRCPKCSTREYDQRRPGDPMQAMEMVTICPNCDDGDFHTPVYLTASGRDVTELSF